MSTNDISMNYGKNFVALEIDGKAIPFRNFTYRVGTGAEEIHLPSKWNAGWHSLAPSFTASMSLYCISLPDGTTIPKIVHQAQLQRKNVMLALVKLAVEGTDSAFDGQFGILSVRLSVGRITEANFAGVEGRAMPLLNISAAFNKFSLETIDAPNGVKP